MPCRWARHAVCAASKFTHPTARPRAPPATACRHSQPSRGRRSAAAPAPRPAGGLRRMQGIGRGLRPATVTLQRRRPACRTQGSPYCAQAALQPAPTQRRHAPVLGGVKQVAAGSAHQQLQQLVTHALLLPRCPRRCRGVGHVGQGSGQQKSAWGQGAGRCGTPDSDAWPPRPPPASSPSHPAHPAGLAPTGVPWVLLARGAQRGGQHRPPGAAAACRRQAAARLQQRACALQQGLAHGARAAAAQQLAQGCVACRVLLSQQVRRPRLQQAVQQGSKGRLRHRRGAVAGAVERAGGQVQRAVALQGRRGGEGCGRGQASLAAKGQQLCMCRSTAAAGLLSHCSTGQRPCPAPALPLPCPCPHAPPGSGPRGRPPP